MFHQCSPICVKLTPKKRKSNREFYSQILAQDGRETFRGARAPSRVVAGALAGHIFESRPFPIKFEDAIGEGANGDMRGRMCSPNLKLRWLMFRKSLH
jgi:hypothetical protein